MRRLALVAAALLVLLGAGVALFTLRSGPGEPGEPGLSAAAAAHPRLPEVRRTMEAYGPLIAEVARTAGGESLVVGHEERAADVAALAAELPAAVDAVTAVWGEEWARTALLVVADSPAEFAGLIRATGPVSPELAAAAIADPFRPGTTPAGQRVVFSPDAGRRLGPDGLATLLRHELTHVAARAVTSDAAPQWVLEGFADYTAHRARPAAFAATAPTLTAALRAGAGPADLPTDADFRGRDAVQAYERAWSAQAYIADAFGEQAVPRLYRRLAAGPLDPAAEDAALRAELGVGRAELVAGWLGWIAGQSGVAAAG
ncbi:hypothetical protein [Nocardia harenae]|uniref:hypothetical protein n=1 Tax=Nocardia harenae TaxID=358707 RepID=UPI000A00810C|nr:hypothetical protein [Nocardia harenae]